MTEESEHPARRPAWSACRPRRVLAPLSVSLSLVLTGPRLPLIWAAMPRHAGEEATEELGRGGWIGNRAATQRWMGATRMLREDDGFRRLRQAARTCHFNYLLEIRMDFEYFLLSI